ncbi:MAG: AAA family ATPase [Pseudomonadota bacterium]
MSDQSATLALLSDPATWGGAVPERIDTHISTVFMAGDTVLKLKKAVTLPFLDFSTVEARRAACEAELEVNRRAAPDLYLGLARVMRAADGRLAVDGDGEAVDWLVRMRRFDQADLFTRLAEDGRLDRRLLQELTEAVVRFHGAAPVRSDRGGVAGLTWTIDTNRASMLPSAPAILDPAKVEALAARSRDWLDRLAPLIEDRRARGLVRQCHGDLHLGNICLFQGRPTLFDAIEFSEDIACIDVFYDLAFLLMDLDCRGWRGFASVVLNHYLDVTGDYEAVPLLPLLLSLRAGVRAHVCATMGAGDDARRYLDAALAYLEPPQPRLLAVGGLSGSGKSRMGRELAPFLAVPGAAVVRTDALRKQMMGVSVHDKLGPDGYTREVTARTYRRLLDTCAALLAAGHSVVADAVFAKPGQRQDIERVAREAGLRFDGLWLEAPPDIARDRIRARTGNASDATVEVFDQQLGYDVGPMSWTRIDTGGSKDEALAAGRAALGV